MKNSIQVADYALPEHIAAIFLTLAVLKYIMTMLEVSMQMCKYIYREFLSITQLKTRSIRFFFLKVSNVLLSKEFYTPLNRSGFLFFDCGVIRVVFYILHTDIISTSPTQCRHCSISAHKIIEILKRFLQFRITFTRNQLR